MKLYRTVKFSRRKNRPFFYANFVMTVDGKTAVGYPGYRPIGSRMDHRILVRLRSRADVLVHGSKTALAHKTVQSLKKMQSGRPAVYAVVSRRPTAALFKWLKDPDINVLLVTAASSEIPRAMPSNIRVVRCGREKINLKQFAGYLSARGLATALVEGGPHLFASFLKAGLMDEIFVTVAPKIFGSRRGRSLTLVEGMLFPPQKIKNLKLISAEKIGDELYLRYRIIR